MAKAKKLNKPTIPTKDFNAIMAPIDKAITNPNAGVKELMPAVEALIKARSLEKDSN